MLVCNNCGNRLRDGVGFCTKCGSPDLRQLVQHDEYGDSYQPNQDYYFEPNDNGGYGRNASDHIREAGRTVAKKAGAAFEAGRNEIKAKSEVRKAADAPVSLGRNIILADGETIIRSYNVTRGSAPGNLTVTNKRIVFTASSGKSKAYMSVPIDSVGSIDIVTGRNIMQLLFGILCCLFFFLVIPLIIGIILIIRSKSMCISISCQNSSPGLVLGDEFTSGKATESIVGRPGRDVNAVMAEVGAMVMDIQQLGDYAIEKWKR